MSLDVYLEGEAMLTVCICPKCDVSHNAIHSKTYFNANITHNLGRMASEAGMYDALWEPDKHGMITARGIAPIILAGLKAMKESPERFTAFSARNGWGTYDQFIPWLEKYLAACLRYPDAKVRVSR